MQPDRSAASDPDGPEEFEGTLMDGLENEPPYPSPACPNCGAPVVEGLCSSVTCQNHNGTSAASIFDAFPEVARSALWPLLGGGLDDKGKEVWLGCERIDGYSDEEIFAHAIRDMNGMVAT